MITNPNSKVRIEFNQKILNYANEYRLPPDLLGTILFVLNAVYEDKTELLDILDDNNSSRRMIFLYQYLVHKGLLMEANKLDVSHYMLTEDGLEFLELLSIETDRLSVQKPESEKPKLQSTLLKSDDNVETWIDDYIKLFPKEKVGSRYLRTTAKECIPKMQMFIKTFGYDKETILKATKAYLKEQFESKDGYIYTRNSSYFIGKQLGKTSADKVSDLATWCARQLDEKESPQENVYDKLV